MSPRLHRVTALVFMAVASAFSVAHAQTPAAGGPSPSRYLDASRGFSVQQLVEMAMEQSKRLESVRQLVDAARGEQQQAALRANPMGTVLQRQQMAGGDTQSAIDLDVPLELFRVGARKAVAASAVDVANAEVDRASSDLASAIRRQTARALAAIAVLESTEQQARAAHELLSLVDATVRTGAIPRLDRDVADVESRRLDAAVAMRRGEVEEALASLKGLIGLDAATPLQLRQPLQMEAMAAVTATASLRESNVEESRADLRVLAARARLFAAETLSARQQGRWDLSLSAGYMRTAMSFPQTALDPAGQPAPIANTFHELTFGATVTMPWRNRNQGAVAAAAARELAAGAERSAATIEAKADVQAARARWNATREAVAIYDGGLLAIARQNLDVVQQTYLAGRGTLNDVITERRRLLDVELGYTDILSALLLADSELRKALGVVR